MASAGAVTVEYKDRPLSAQFGAAASFGYDDRKFDGELDPISGKRVTIAEQNLLADSGYKLDPKDPWNHGPNDEETKKEKEREAAQRFAFVAEEIASQKISYGGVDLSFAAVTKSIETDISINNSMARIAQDYVEVKDEEMLRLDASGNRISAKDDPEGKFIVKTTAERLEWEAKQKTNQRVFSQEDVTLTPEGKRVSTQSQMDLLGFQDRAQTGEIALGDLRSGKIKLDQTDKSYLDGAKQAEQDRLNPPVVSPEFQARIDSYAKSTATESKALQPGEPEAPKPAPQFAPSAPSF